MLHKIIDWLAYKLHIKKREEFDALQTMIDLLPTIYGAAMLLGIASALKLPALPWYDRLWYWIKWQVRRARSTLIGY